MWVSLLGGQAGRPSASVRLVRDLSSAPSDEATIGRPDPQDPPPSKKIPSISILKDLFP